MKRVCFYHDDLDGHCSAAIVYNYFKECRVDDIEMIEISYGDEFPWDDINPGAEIWMVDFCLTPFVQMIKLVNTFKKVVWIDHHIGNIRDEDSWLGTLYSKPVGYNNFFGLRRTGVGACRLTWEFLYPNEPIPEAIELISLWDTWQWKDHFKKEKVLQFCYGMEVQDTLPDSELWKQLLDKKISGNLLYPGDTSSKDIISDIVQDGKLILKYEEKANYILACRLAFLLEFEGIKFLAANRPSGSEFFKDVISNYPDAQAILVFIWSKGKYNVRMYTENKDLDLSVIAKKYGGSGHAGACGFDCTSLPFELR